MILYSNLTSFSSPPEVISGTGNNVTDPACTNLAHTTRTNELVEKHIGYRSDQCQVGFGLSYYFMARCKRDKGLLGSAHSDLAAIVYITANCFREAAQLGSGHDFRPSIQQAISKLHSNLDKSGRRVVLL